MFEGTNWLAVITATLSSQVVAAIWYAKLFTKTWLKETGFTEAELKANPRPMLFFGGSLMLAFVAALFIWHFVSTCQLTGMKALAFGMLDGAVIALATVLPAMATNAIYDRKSLRYVLVNVGYWVVCFAVMGGILNVWK